MLIKQMTLLFFLTSCALFKSEPSLKSLDKLKLLDSVNLIGEGTGRLSFGEGQYVFGVDSILKENFDWILAVSIPLHGEEVMILPNLKAKEASFEETESFEERIGREFSKINLDESISTQEFLAALRSLVRFNLSPKWGGQRNCRAHQNDMICDFEGEIFRVMVSDREIMINKALGKGRSLGLNAKNLTESFFEQTDIRLYLGETNFQKNLSSFSLELFWKK